MDHTEGPFAVVSSPGYTRGRDTLTIISDALDEAEVPFEEDPETQVQGYEERDLPDQLLFLRDTPYDAFLHPEAEGGCLEAWQEDREWVIQTAKIVLIDFTHAPDRASKTLALCRRLRPEPGSTIAISREKQHLMMPEGVRHLVYRSRPNLARLLRDELAALRPRLSLPVS